jgi:alkylation response protein AidB-like acyl-CoA dehydrogenase
VDFAFSDEQQMLRDQARTVLKDPTVSWEQLVELGWVGSGMSFLDEAVLFEEMGRTLHSGAYFATVGLCAPALEGAEPATLAWAEPGGPLSMSGTNSFGTKAERSGEAWLLSGDKILVPDLEAAERVVVIARTDEGVALFLAAAEGTASRTMDESRPLSTMSWTSEPAELLAGPDRAGAILGEIRRRAFAALALEAVGVASVALEMAVEFSKSRQQFDKPIGTYQAVSHQVADSYVETELARSLAYWAAWCVSEGDDQAEVAALAAKAFASEAAVRSCERSIQVHGGMGFTWESPLHGYYKRAQWIQAFEGYPARQRSEVAAILLER